MTRLGGSTGSWLGARALISVHEVHLGVQLVDDWTGRVGGYFKGRRLQMSGRIPATNGANTNHPLQSALTKATGRRGATGGYAAGSGWRKRGRLGVNMGS